MHTSVDRSASELLAALPLADWERLAPQLEAIELPLGAVIGEAGVAMQHVVFPTTAIVCLLCVLEDGSTAEVALVGREGVVGSALFMGGGGTPRRAVVMSAGQGYRLRAAAIQQAFGQGGAVMQRLLCHTQALMGQIAQTAACNRHHALEQQLCRWLLLSLDRLSGDELVMTQELIANLMGVRREGVTKAALRLAQLSLIRYTRGHIHVLDRAGLEQRVCECYGTVRREYQRLLPPRVGPR